MYSAYCVCRWWIWGAYLWWRTLARGVVGGSDGQLNCFVSHCHNAINILGRQAFWHTQWGVRAKIVPCLAPGVWQLLTVPHWKQNVHDWIVPVALPPRSAGSLEEIPKFVWVNCISLFSSFSSKDVISIFLLKWKGNVLISIEDSSHDQDYHGFPRAFIWFWRSLKSHLIYRRKCLSKVALFVWIGKRQYTMGKSGYNVIFV